MVGREQIEFEIATTARRLLDQGADEAEIIGVLITYGAEKMIAVVGYGATAAQLRIFADRLERRAESDQA